MRPGAAFRLPEPPPRAPDAEGAPAAPAPRAAPVVGPALVLRPVHRSPAFAFFCAYALFVAYATLLPFQFLADGALLAAKRNFINWNPFVLVTGEPTPITDLVMNVAFFVPLGFIGFHAQRRRRPVVAVLRAAQAGLLLSLGVEALQFLTPSRNPATSDVLTNGAGTALGALLAATFQVQLEGRLRRQLTAWMRCEPLLPVLAGYAVLVIVGALVPFDLAGSVSWIKHGLRAARLDPRGGPPLGVADVQMALEYAILAGLGFRVARRMGRGAGQARALGWALGCGIAAAVLGAGLELAQVLIRSRVCSTRDALAAAAGAGAGPVVAWMLGAGIRARAGWTLAGIAYVAVITVQSLAPFRFEFDPQAMRDRLTYTALIPYSSYYYKANLAAVTDFLEGMLAVVPLAFVLARARAGLGGALGLRPGAAIVALCAAFALALEVLQLGVPKRYPEISDILTAALGAALGAYAWRWFAHLGRRAEVPPPTAP